MAIIDLTQIRPAYMPSVSGGDMRTSFSGCKVNNLGANQTVLAGALDDVTWLNEEFDEGGWFDIGNPTKLIVPAGVTRVRHFGSAQFLGAWGSSDVVNVTAAINDVHFAGSGIASLQLTNIFNTWPMLSPPYPVTPGDELSLRVHALAITPASLTVIGALATTFGVEAV